MTDKPKSKWYWRWLRRGFIGVAVLATLIAILVTEEDWRGKHDWEAYRHAAEARGERLDLASVVPPAVPDDQNFFCAPIVAETLSSEWKHQNNGISSRMVFDIYRDEIGNKIKQGGNWQKGTLTDLKQWQTAFRELSATPEGKTNGFPVPAQPQTPAADVLFGLSVFDPALAELRQASQRPYMRIPLNYEDDFESVQQLLPWLATMKRCAQFLNLRITAEEQNHEGAQALADVELLLRVNSCIREQPFLISQLVHMAIMAILVQPVYEGLAQHCWSDAQLAELEQALAKEDFLSDYEFAMKGEELFAINTFEKQRITREMKNMGDNEQIITNSLRWMPSAYFYQTELAFARMHDELIAPLADVANRTVSVAAYKAANAENNRQMKHWSLYKVQAGMVFPAIAKSVEKFAFVQAATDLARTACALERYRLAHGEYPASLDLLAPQFIEKVPHDVINGQPLHYRRMDGGKFLLYSVGWNEKDDGGVIGTEEDVTKGDWVWKN